MQDVFVGRQPIYNTKLDVVAYELLFRSGTDNKANIIDDDQATGQVLLNTLVEIGLDNLVGERLAFINCTRKFILDQDNLSFDKDRIVIEVLETIEPDDEIVEALQRVAEAGYKVVLDDFIYEEKYRRFVEIAETVKLDVSTLDRERLTENVQILRNYGIKQLLAEKVETIDEFEFCKELGFDLFQGYFLSRPKIVKGKSIPSNRIAAMQLLAKLQDPEVGYEELEKIVSRDVALSYKVLHYINSASIGQRKKIESLRQAIAMLGLHRLKTMATLITMAGINDKVQAVMNNALTRARMCELLASDLKRVDGETFYVVGLFSSLDVLMDNTMEEVLKTLPLTDDVKGALLHREGAMGEALRCAIAYEQNEWDNVHCLGIDPATIHQAYLQAVAEVEGGLGMAQQLQSGAASVNTTEKSVYSTTKQLVPA